MTERATNKNDHKVNQQEWLLAEVTKKWLQRHLTRIFIRKATRMITRAVNKNNHEVTATINNINDCIYNQKGNNQKCKNRKDCSMTTTATATNNDHKDITAINHCNRNDHNNQWQIAELLYKLLQHHFEWDEYSCLLTGIITCCIYKIENHWMKGGPLPWKPLSGLKSGL